MGIIASRFRRKKKSGKNRREGESGSDSSSSSSDDEYNDALEIGEMAWEGLFELVCTQLDATDWAMKPPRDLEAEIDKQNEARVAKEEEEAVEAEAEAQREFEEYEEARLRMLKEKEEMEEAQRVAEKEIREAEEAEAAARKEIEEAEAAEAEARKEMEEAEEAERLFAKEEEEAVEAEQRAELMRKRAEEAEMMAERAEQAAHAEEFDAGEHAVDFLMLGGTQHSAADEANRLREAAVQARRDLEEAEADAKREREEAEGAKADAIREREEAEEALAAAIREREEADEATAAAKKEREEAEAAMREAKREREEYEFAMGEMEREKREWEEARRRAERERGEAEDARVKNEQRKALHEIQTCITNSDSARQAVTRCLQVVPDDHLSMELALDHATHAPPPKEDPARVVVRSGRHAVSLGEDANYEVRGYAEIVGDDAAVLVGSLLLLEGGGVIRNVTIESGDGPCVWCMGGEWRLEGCTMVSTCRGRAALVCDKEASIVCEGCILNGGGKRAERQWGGVDKGAKCFAGISALGKARVSLINTRVTGFKEAALLLQERATAHLVASTLEACRAAVSIGHEGGRDIFLSAADTLFDCLTVWSGELRPRRVEEERCRYVTFSSPRDGYAVDGRLQQLE